MYKFAIKNPVYDHKTVAWLYYDEEKREYEIRIRRRQRAWRLLCSSRLLSRRGRG